MDRIDRMIDSVEMALEEMNGKKECADFKVGYARAEFRELIRELKALRKAVKNG